MQLAPRGRRTHAVRHALERGRASFGAVFGARRFGALKIIARGDVDGIIVGSPHDSESAEGYRYRRQLPSKGELMAKATVEVLVDDLDGSEGAETVRIGWNGEWRSSNSKKNLSALSRALDKYWDVSRPVARDGHASGRRRSARARSTRPANRTRDPQVIRAWAIDNGISVPARGRIPGDVERQYKDAVGRS